MSKQREMNKNSGNINISCIRIEYLDVWTKYTR